MSRGNEIKFFAMECELNPKTCGKSVHNVTRYPWVAYFNSSDSPGQSFQFDLPQDFKESVMKFHKPEVKPFENQIPEYWEDEEAQIHHVTDENWEQWRSSHGATSVVFFYAPWCGSCKKMRPTFAEASLRLVEKNESVQMAAIDCTENIVICGQFDVKQFPTAYFFKDAEDEGEVMTLPHSVGGIYKGIQKLVKKDGREVLPFVNEKPEGWGDADSKDVIHLDDEHWMSWRQENPRFFVMMYAPWCGHCTRLKPDFAAASTELLAQKVPLVGVDCTVETEICSKFDVKSYPTLKWFSTSDEYDEGESYSSDWNKDAIVEFVQIKLGQSDDAPQADADDMEEIDSAGDDE
jgi:thioredoxin-like negative regulator of GroEL